jgi:hypothetical protein
MNTFKTEIHERALSAAREFKKAEASLISILQEVEESRLFLDLGITSLFQYAVKSLGLSEDVAFNFITVSRKAKQMPILQEAILSGVVSVSKARKVASVLTLENQSDWIEKIKTCSSKTLEREVAKVNPREATPEQTKYVSENRLELKMGISQEMLEQLKRVQDLESKRTARAVSMEEALQALLSLYLETKDPQKRAERVLKNAAKRPVSRREKQLSQSDNPRAIPAWQKHQLIARDQGQCTHRDNEKRCENRRWTHTHHIIPRSVGGDHSLENLTTLCSVHHKMIHRNH